MEQEANACCAAHPATVSDQTTSMTPMHHGMTSSSSRVNAQRTHGSPAARVARRDRTSLDRRLCVLDDVRTPVFSRPRRRRHRLLCRGQPAIDNISGAERSAAGASQGLGAVAQIARGRRGRVRPVSQGGRRAGVPAPAPLARARERDAPDESRRARRLDDVRRRLSERDAPRLPVAEPAADAPRRRAGRRAGRRGREPRDRRVVHRLRPLVGRAARARARARRRADRVGLQRE